jgi:D-alanyl-D-alanine carboxypeptidase (penicillin-binding protein 5/6)
VKLKTHPGFYSMKNVFNLMFFILALITSVTVNAAVPVPAPPEVAAKNYLLVDVASGKVLAEKNADAKIEPASITKLMTAHIVYKEMEAGRLSMDDMVTISEKAWRMGGSRMYLDVNTKVPVRELLKGLIIQSGNDASVALAEHIAGTEDAFVQLMNQNAKELGMDNTHFVNSTGWPDKQHLTTARDIAKLAVAIIHESPEHYAWYAEKEFTYNNIKQYNRNKLLWRDESVDGIKTGHTDSAGYCLVSSALRGDMRIVSVVLGTDSEKARADVSQALLNYGFRFYESHTLYQKGDVLNRPRVWGGEYETLEVGLDKDLAVTIPRGTYDELDATMDIDKNIEAPVAKSQKVGEVKVSLNGELLESVPLVALETVNEGGIIQRAKDYILRMIN